MATIYTVNAAGKAAILNWVGNRVRPEIDPRGNVERENAWLEAAEQAANDAWPDQDATMEIAGQYRESKQPAVLMLAREWFAAEEVE